MRSDTKLQSEGQATRGRCLEYIAASIIGFVRQAALKDMSDNWVRASIDYVPKDHPHLKYYKMELEYRLVRGITIEDLES